MSNKHKDEHFPGDRAQLVSCIESILELNQHGMIEGGIHRMVRQLLRGAVLHLTAPVPIKREDLSTRELLFRAMQRLRGKTADGDEAKLIMELSASVPKATSFDFSALPSARQTVLTNTEPGAPNRGPWGQGYLFGYNQGFAMATARVEGQIGHYGAGATRNTIEKIAKQLRDEAEREQHTQKAAGCLPVLPVELTEALATNQELREQLTGARAANDTLRSANESLLTENAELRQEAEDLRSQNAELRAALDDAKKPLASSWRIAAGEVEGGEGTGLHQKYDILRSERGRGHHYHAISVVKRIAGRSEDTAEFAEIHRRLTGECIG